MPVVQSHSKEGDGAHIRADQLTPIWGAPKSLQMVSAAMKLKDTCSLEEKL